MLLSSTLCLLLAQGGGAPPRPQPTPEQTAQTARQLLARLAALPPIDDGGMHVCCADAVVRVGQVQAPGKRRMSALEYAAGRPFADGERLGR
jgi:methionyl-tRNA formyltransferase